MMSKKQILNCVLVSVGFCSFQFLNAQEVNYPLNYFSHLYLEDGYSRLDSINTSAYKSTPESWLVLDSVWAYGIDETYYSVAAEKLHYDHLFNIRKDDFNVSIDLLGKQQFGMELSDTSTYSDTTFFYNNSRGFLLKGSIGHNFSFESSFIENQVYVPTYMRSFIDQRGVYPGGGRSKDFNAGGFDYAQSGGYLSYSPTKFLNLQFGHGKNFIGFGHRSLLLSDNTNNYPYLTANVKLWNGKVKYHTTLANLQNLERLPLAETPESRFKIKNANFHFVEFTPRPQLSLGIFESTIWKRYDEIEGVLGFNYESINPVIGLNSLGLADNDLHKSILGLNAAYQINKNIKLYGQFLIDKEGNGMQLGVRTTNLFLERLFLLAEYNQVDPYTYTFSDHLQNYSHMNQELAHPLGAGFDEIVLRGTWFLERRVYADLQFNLSNNVIDYTDTLGLTNIGSNIFLDNGTPRQGMEDHKQTRSYTALTFGYMFNPMSNLNAYIRWIYRGDGNSVEHDNSFITIGFTTSIFNEYQDF